MINQLLKIGFFYQVWRWLKPRAKLLFMTFMIILITWILHAEFTEYLSQLKNIDDSYSDVLLGVSYLLKLAITIGVIFFIYVNEKLRIKGIQKPSKPKADITKTLAPKQVINDSDPFLKIREKKKLQSRAEKLVK